ncbi:MAG: response regulator transcription factor [Dehalococcoidia bacterium]|nr:response regulator transcription factor [Dehalococcoidia bacterium]
MDDFIVHPYNPQELVKRIDRVLARSREPESNEVVKTGDLVIDIGKYEISLGGRRVILTYKEYQLLVLLATNPGRVYTRDELLQQVWGYDYFGGTRTVDVHIRRLRSKIESANHSFIETIWNVGYRFRNSS